MGAPFTDFLREQAAKKEAETKDAKSVVNEWRTAIEHLFDQIRTWLADSDPDGIIDITQREHDVSEPGLGRYSVPCLELRALDKWIGIIPKARKTVGSAQPPRKSGSSD